MQRRRKKRFKRFVFRVVLLIIFAGALIWASWLEQFSIQKIVIVGTSGQTASGIEQAVNNILDQRYFGVVPKRNFLIYPKRAIIQNVLKAYPEIGSAGVGTELVHTLNIRLRERSPAALWCQNDLCYVMDDSAYVYALAASSSPNGALGNAAQKGNLLPIYATATTTDNPVGKRPLLAETFSSMLSTAIELSSSSLPVENVSITGDGQYIFKIARNGKIIFSNRKPFQQSLGDLISALHSPVFASSAAFQYIDVRFGNKVFYRLGKAGTAESSAGSSILLSTSTANATSTANTASGAASSTTAR